MVTESWLPRSSTRTALDGGLGLPGPHSFGCKTSHLEEVASLPVIESKW